MLGTLISLVYVDDLTNNTSSRLFADDFSLFTDAEWAKQTHAKFTKDLKTVINLAH